MSRMSHIHTSERSWYGQDNNTEMQKGYLDVTEMSCTSSSAYLKVGCDSRKVIGSEVSTFWSSHPKLQVPCGDGGVGVGLYVLGVPDCC